MLEITPPKEVLTPLKAMEDVFGVVWSSLVDVANFREIWFEGELDNTPYWMSWEIVSIEGHIHFFARVMSSHRQAVEAALYSYYPDLEIQEVPDYARNVPQNIPNEEWNLYGEEFNYTNKPVFPIKTYEKFFEPQGERISAEEKRIDPINSLLESLSRLGQGEQYWIQFITAGVTDHDAPFLKGEAEKAISKIAKRPEKKATKTFIQEAMDQMTLLTVGPTKEQVEGKASRVKIDSETGEREMLLTPGERELLTEIENKTRKAIFRTTMRGMYIARKENWKPANRILLRSYMGHFSTNTSRLREDVGTKTKVHYLFRKRRVFFRARRMMRNAILRFPPYFPDRVKGGALLSVEELATLIHFPVKITSLAFPTVERVEHRKGGPPPNLPTE